MQLFDRMTLLAKTLQPEATNVMNEVTISKASDDDSPEFPIVLGVSTMETFISDVKRYLGVSDIVSGIVIQYYMSLKMITQTKDLLKEASVEVILKKGKNYIKMTSV